MNTAPKPALSTSTTVILQIILTWHNDSSARERIVWIPLRIICSESCFSFHLLLNAIEFLATPGLVNTKHPRGL